MHIQIHKKMALVKTYTYAVKYVSAKGHEIKERGLNTCHHYWPRLQMGLSQHGSKKVKSLTVQVKFLISDSLMSFVFLK